MLRRPGRVPFLLLLLVAAGVGIGLERLIVTDAEAVEDVVVEATKAVDRGDFEAFGRLLSPTYRGEGGTRDGAVARVRKAWRADGPRALASTVIGVQVDGDAARAQVNVRGFFLGRLFLFRLDVGFVREADGWRVASAEVRDSAG